MTMTAPTWAGETAMEEFLRAQLNYIVKGAVAAERARIVEEVAAWLRDPSDADPIGGAWAAWSGVGLGGGDYDPEPLIRALRGRFS